MLRDRENHLKRQARHIEMPQNKKFSCGPSSRSGFELGLLVTHL